jgi:hypothetical protein
MNVTAIRGLFEMDNLKAVRIYVRMTIALGLLSLLAVVFSHFALTDIYHGEADLSLEWSMLRMSALVILVFIGSTLATLTRVLELTK